MQFRFHALALAALTAALSAQAAGPGSFPSVQNTAGAAPARSAAELLNAKVLTPRVNALPASVLDFNAAVEAARLQSPVVVMGSKGGRDASHLRVDLDVPAGLAAAGDVGTEAVGTGGQYFTSSRVSPKAVDTTFPVRTVGKLYFNIGTAGYMCSASVIKPGVVLTSGHCVHSGNGLASGWYNSFQFIPGYRKVGSKITQPYGAWTNWASARTTLDWFNGGGGVPNTGDWALITFNVDGSGNRVGDYTGWLGYATGSAIGRHLTVLGYPGNLDSGGQLHRIDAMGTDYGSLNTVSYGSDMEGGSSGGPLVMNWRVDYSNSSTAPSENGGNLATSTVSWGYISTAPKVQGGSQFNTTFVNLLNAACTAYPWSC